MEKEKTYAELESLSNEILYPRNDSGFFATDEVKQILLKSEKQGKISDKARDELYQIGHYETGLEQSDVRNAIAGLKQAIRDRQTSRKRIAETQPRTDGENAPVSNRSGQDASKLYKPEVTEDDLGDAFEPEAVKL